jgi:hypothetical protein
MNTNQPGSNEQQSPQKGQPPGKNDPQRKPTHDTPPGGAKDRGSSQQQQRPGSPGSGSQPKHDQNS